MSRMTRRMICRLIDMRTALVEALPVQVVMPSTYAVEALQYHIVEGAHLAQNQASKNKDSGVPGSVAQSSPRSGSTCTRCWRGPGGIVRMTGTGLS